MGFLTPGPTVSFFGAAFASFSKRALYPRAQSEERQSDEFFRPTETDTVSTWLSIR